MKCEHLNCPDDAEVWVAVNEKPVRLCSKHHRFATRDGAWVETFWEADIDGPAPKPSRRPTTDGAETSSPPDDGLARAIRMLKADANGDPIPVAPKTMESFSAAQVEEPPGPPAEPTPEVVHPPTPMATPSPVPSGRDPVVPPKTRPPQKKPRGGRHARYFPLILRIDADATPSSVGSPSARSSPGVAASATVTSSRRAVRSGPTSSACRRVRRRDRPFVGLRSGCPVATPAARSPRRRTGGVRGTSSGSRSWGSTG